MFLVPIKLVNFGFSPQEFFFFFWVLIQSFQNILVLVYSVSLPVLSDDMDDEEPHHPSHVATYMILVLMNFTFSP